MVRSVREGRCGEHGNARRHRISTWLRSWSQVRPPRREEREGEEVTPAERAKEDADRIDAILSQVFAGDDSVTRERLQRSFMAMPFLGIEGRVKALRAVNALLWMLQGSPDAMVDEADIQTVREMLEKQLEALAEVKSEVPDYADVMPLKQFLEACACNGFTDDDGHGYFCTDEKTMTKVPATPSQVFSSRCEDFPKFTHVAWFNK